MSLLLSRRVSDLESESKDHKKRLDAHDIIIEAHDKMFKSFEDKFGIIKGSLETLLNRIPIKKKLKLSWKNLTPGNVAAVIISIIIILGAAASNG